MKEKIPHRKQIRLKDYDYSQEGYYFITICTQNKKHILGKIFNKIDKSVGVAPQGDPQNENVKILLTREGKIVKKYLENYNKIYDNIFIDEYIIMPNHIHFIITLTERVAQGCDPYNTKNN